MRTFKPLFALLLIMVAAASALAQRKVSDCTLVYDIQVQTNNQQPQMADMFDGATTTVYIKGHQSRSDMVSSLGVQSTIIDTRTGNVVVLKDYGEQHFLIRMNRDNWEDVNKKYEGLKFETGTETKTISGYKCVKAVGTMSDGKQIVVFYTTEVIPENHEFDYAFKSLPGLVMEYETQIGATKVRYTVSKINFNNIPAARFDIPKTGYRELTYEESKGKKQGR
jgi:GLPGLI family protein